MQVTRTPAAKPFTFTQVTINETLVEHLIQAERATGRTDGYEFSIGVMSQVCVFDGLAQPVEELRRMRHGDFLALSKEINGDEPSPDTAPES